MKKTLYYIAIFSWILGLLVHTLSIFDIDVADKFPLVWILNVVIIIVWIPTIFELRKIEELKGFQQSGKFNQMNPFGFFKIIFRNSPQWLKFIAIGSFFYAILNFALFILAQTGTASIENGQYVLNDHGQLLKTLSEQEYHHFKANELRGFSGHWLMFYGMAAAVLFPTKEQQISN